MDFLKHCALTQRQKTLCVAQENKERSQIESSVQT